MSIYQSIKDDLALILTATTGLTVTSAHFDILATKATVDQEGGRNTKAGIRFNATALIRGDAIVYYDRLDVAGLRKLRNPNIAVKAVAENGVSVYDVLPSLRNEFGAVFTTSDLVETFGVLNGDSVDILVKAKPASQGWIGQDTIQFPQVPKLATAFSNTTLPGF